MGDMLMVLQCAEGARDSVRFQLPVGTRTSADPCGPDAYGYYAFDNTDTAYPQAPTYSWVELDPVFGGTGSQVQLGDYGNDQDKSTTLDMPFTFTYFGVDYDRATVCSNGWMVMGSTYLANYRNWTIPSAGGPNGVIAGFWDDLYESGNGKVVQKYDAAEHRWIVEWSRMSNLVNGAQETFEIILYDPAFHTTETGDGIIEFQYQTVNNVDSVDGYATVGIEKPDNSEGVLYTYFNDYAPGAVTLGTGRAIRFVPLSQELTAIGGEPPEASPAAPFGFTETIANPLRPGEEVVFSVDRPGAAQVSVFDASGRAVRVLTSGLLPAGRHAVVWDGKDESGRPAASGIYFYSLVSGKRTAARKVLLTR